MRCAGIPPPFLLVAAAALRIARYPSPVLLGWDMEGETSAWEGAHHGCACGQLLYGLGA